MQALRARPIAVLVVLGVIFLVVDAWAHISRAYPNTWWPDIITHFIYGAWFALALVRFAPQVRPLAIFAAVMLVGVGWEILEFAYDVWYAGPRGADFAQHGWPDTLKDTMVNAVGAGLALRLFAKHPVEREF